MQRLYGLPYHALIDMGDFVGGTLKYLRTHPVPRLTIAGGFAKLAKLAAGHLDLDVLMAHPASRRSGGTTDQRRTLGDLAVRQTVRVDRR